MLVPLVRTRDRLLRIGAQPTDRPEDRVRKQALVLTSAAISILAIVWVATYLALGRPLSAAIPFTYQIISVVGLAYFARTGNFAPFRLTQVASMLVLPFVLQWSLGGFVNSGAVMVWAFASPIAALVLYSTRQAASVFAGFVALTVASGLLDPILSASAVPLPADLRLLFFVLDIGAVSIVAYAVLQYFVAARERAQQETDRVLYNILPVQIADRLRAGEQRIADDFAAVTVVFSDVAGFTPLARTTGADEVIEILDRLFSAFDSLADRYGLEKIKTIGDAYMAVAGAPEPRTDHVRAGADMALAMIDETARVGAELKRDLALRVGIHTGPAAAGVIGQRKFIYDLWGDAVNVASRMETHGVAGRIHVSEAVESALHNSYQFEERGGVDVKGLGEMRTFFLLGPKTADQ
jgi:adenylate cyclase